MVILILPIVHRSIVLQIKYELGDSYKKCVLHTNTKAIHYFWYKNQDNLPEAECYIFTSVSASMFLFLLNVLILNDKSNFGLLLLC